MSVLIPDASPAVQEAFRSVQRELDKLSQSKLNIDLAGKRIINAGSAVAATDYVTKAQLDASAGGNGGVKDPLTISQITVRSLLTVLGNLRLPRFTDGTSHHAILFVDSEGQVNINEDGAAALDLNIDLLRLEIGYGLMIWWFSQAGLSSPSADLVVVIGSDGVNPGNFKAKNIAGESFTVNGTPGATGSGTTVTVEAGIVKAVSNSGGGSPTYVNVTADKFIATGAQTYHPTIGGTRRTFDSTTVTLAQLAEVVGTLLGDLAGIGLTD